MSRQLTFEVLRQANTHRLPKFKNRKGEPAHSKPDGSDWALSAWSNAVAGEVGEAANIIKKIERGDFTLDEVRGKLAEELADVVTYLDILAKRAGIDLGDAVIEKFNKISDSIGCMVKIMPDGRDWELIPPGDRCISCRVLITSANDSGYHIPGTDLQGNGYKICEKCLPKYSGSYLMPH